MLLWDLGGVCHLENLKQRATNLALYYDLPVFKDAQDKIVNNRAMPDK